MGNITNGSGAAVRASINNSLPAYDECFYGDLQYYYLRNVKQILTFDSMGDNGVTYSGGAYNTTYYKIGDASRGFTNSAGPQNLEASWSSNINLAAFQDGGASLTEDYLSLVVYIGGTLPTSLVIGFSTSQSNYTAKNFEKTISSGLAAGYSFIHIAKSDFTKTGTGFDWNGLAYLKLGYTGGDGATDVYFDNLQLIRKDPDSPTPNPFQIQTSTTWSRALGIKSGEWFVGKDNGVLIYKNLNPQDDTAALQRNITYNDFLLACELRCLTDNYLYGPSWYVDANNYFKAYIDSNQLTLAYNINGAPGSVSAAMTVVKNDTVTFKVTKNGSSVFLAATKNTDWNNPCFLEADININTNPSGGMTGLCSKGDKYNQIISYAVTQLEYASYAGDGADDYWKGQLANKQCNVRIFGAKGDGVTDDTAAIQNAINHINSFGGGTLVLPKGRYRVTSQLTLYGNLMIDGCNSTLYVDPAAFLQKLIFLTGYSSESKNLTADGALGSCTISVTDTNGLASGDYVLISDTSLNGLHIREFLCIDSVTTNNVTFTSALSDNYTIANSALIQKIAPANNITIRDLIVECSPTSDITYPVFCTNISNSVFRNIQILNLRSITEPANQVGIYILNGLNVEINGCYLTKKSGNYYGIIAESVSNLTVKNNRFVNFKNSLYVYRSAQTIIAGNQLKGCSGGDYGLNITGCLYTIIEGNAVSGGYTTAIKITNSGRIAIKNNTLVGTTTNVAITIGNTVSGVYESCHIIEGNIIEKSSSAGIYLGDGASKTIIKGNHIKDTITQAIYISSGGAYSSVIGNTIINPGSDGIFTGATGCIISNNMISNAGGIPINSSANDVIISNNYIDGWSGTSGGCRYQPKNSLLGNVFKNSDVTKYSLSCPVAPLPNDGTSLIGNISPTSPYESGSLARLDTHSVNLGNALWNVGQKLLHHYNSPTTGTFCVGDKVYYRNPPVNNYIGEVCTTAGTKGTLNGGNTTGSINSGTNILTVYPTATGLVVGCYITIAGVSGPKRVTAVDGTTITIDSNANTDVSNAVVAYSAPVMKGFGLLQP